MKPFFIFLSMLLAFTCSSQPGFYKEATILFTNLSNGDGQKIGHDMVASGTVQFLTWASKRQQIFAKANRYDSSSLFLRLEGSGSIPATSMVIVTPNDTMYLLNLPDNNVNIHLIDLKIRTGIYDLREYLDTTTVDSERCFALRIKDCAVNMDSCICEKGGIKQFVLLKKNATIPDLRYEDPKETRVRAQLNVLRPFVFSEILQRQLSNGRRILQPLTLCANEGLIFNW